MYQELQGGSGGSGGNAQYEKIPNKAMSNTWNRLDYLDCDVADLLNIIIRPSAGQNYCAIMYSNGDGTFSTIKTSSYVDIRVNNGYVEFYYNWTGGGVEYDIDYCYSA